MTKQEFTKTFVKPSKAKTNDQLIIYIVKAMTKGNCFQYSEEQQQQKREYWANQARQWIEEYM